MPWFKVDDSFHAHPKVLATDADALGLWVVAGAWSSSHLTDGFVPDHALPRLLPDSATLARKLVAAGLWRKVRGGYRFHDWSSYNPESGTVLAEREAARERMRAVRAKRKQTETNGHRGDFEQGLNKGRGNDEKRAKKDGSAGQDRNRSPEQPANVRGVFGNPDPTRPDLIGGALGDPLTPPGREPPPPRCPEHLDNPDPPPCGACADARRARTRRELADSARRRTAPQCRTHRGQPAGNCGLCRADALAAPDEED